MRGKERNMFILPRFDEPVMQRKYYKNPRRCNAYWKDTEHLRKFVERGVITLGQFTEITSEEY